MVIRLRRVFLLLLSLACGFVAAPQVARAAAQLLSVELTYQRNSTRVALGLPRPLAFQALIDGSSGAGSIGRLVVEFPGLAQLPNGGIGRGSGLVRSYRAEAMPAGGVRVIMELARPATISSVRALPTEAGRPARAVIDLAASNPVAMRAVVGVAWHAGATAPPAASQQARAAAARESIAALIDRPARPAPLPSPVAPPATPPKSPVLIPAAVALAGVPRTAPAAGVKRVIVIDAGHGGIDPGANSVAGYHEKEITLGTARLLRRVLEQTGRYKVVLTRDADIYLKLHERVRLARAAHGNLFISLHADSVAGGSSSARGASIYTLSENASDAETDRLAQRENRADAIGGVDLGDQSDDVAGILVDLTVRETVNNGNRLAGMMVDSLQQQGIGLLPSSPHRSAGFAVLKSPDIPSVLIEMGYLSDHADARDLADPRHELQIAKAIAEGVDRYFTWVQTARS